MHSITSSALPTARPSGASIAVMIASVFTPDALPIDDQRFGEPARIGLGLHERAAAGLDVEHQRVDALGDLLAHDRRADERDALDRAGHVAQRVQLLVGRRDLRRLADHRAADVARAPPSSRRATGSTRKPGIASSLSSVPPVCPRPRPDIIGTGTPHAAASGARISDVLSPTPPVLCLSTFTPGNVAQVDADARVHHRVGEPRGFLRRHAAQQDRHQQRRRLVVGQRAGGDAVDEEADLVARRARRRPVSS